MEQNLYTKDFSHVCYGYTELTVKDIEYRRLTLAFTTIAETGFGLLVENIHWWMYNTFWSLVIFKFVFEIFNIYIKQYTVCILLHLMNHINTVNAEHQPWLDMCSIYCVHKDYISFMQTICSSLTSTVFVEMPEWINLQWCFEQKQRI